MSIASAEVLCRSNGAARLMVVYSSGCGVSELTPRVSGSSAKCRSAKPVVTLMVVVSMRPVDAPVEDAVAWESDCQLAC